MHRFSEKTVLLLISLLFLLGLWLNIGVQPFYLEEPRRVFISMEMVQNGNLWAPTQLGEYYYNKPPLYNWLLIACATLFGGFTETAMRIPTVLSTLLWGLLVFYFGKKAVDQRFGSYAGLLTVGSSGILMYFSTIAEIDIFYSLISFAGMGSIYFFEKKEQYLRLFLTVYLFTAIGFMTKGIPSLAFTAISLLVWFIAQKKFLKLLSWQHVLGILLFSGLIGAYYWKYSQYNDPLNVLAQLWDESSRRTEAEGRWTDFFLHLLVFPFDLLKDILPAGFLIFFCFRKKLLSSLRTHSFIWFSSLLFISNLILYWLAPETRMRYVYMLYPFMIYALLWVWQTEKARPWMQKTFTILSAIVIHALPLGLLSLPFIPDLQDLPGRWWISLGGVALLVLPLLLYWKRPQLRLAALLLTMGVARLVYDLTILPERAVDSGAQRDKARAEQIYELVGEAPLYSFGSEKLIAYTSTVYLDRLRKTYLRRAYLLKQGCYYLVDRSDIPENARILLEYEYDGERALIHLE